MGKTYKRNDRWKKDRRDKNFRNSKKFKEFKHEKHTHKPAEVPPIEIDDDNIDNSINNIVG